jgi:hypothetical protein
MRVTGLGNLKGFIILVAAGFAPCHRDPLPLIVETLPYSQDLRSPGARPDAPRLRCSAGASSMPSTPVPLPSRAAYAGNARDYAFASIRQLFEALFHGFQKSSPIVTIDSLSSASIFSATTCQRIR